MKRLLYVVIMIIAVCLILSPSSTWAAGKKINLAIASWNVPKDPNSKVLKAIADDLKAATGGLVTSTISYKAL